MILIINLNHQHKIYYLLLSLKPKKKENNLNITNIKDSIFSQNNTSTTFIDNNLTPDVLNSINNNFKAVTNNNNFFDLNSDFFNLKNSNIKIGESINNVTQNIQTNEDSIINNNKVFNDYFNDDNSPFNLINNSNKNNEIKINDNNINKKLIFELKVNGIIPCVNLSLCLNDYTKISEFFCHG